MKKTHSVLSIILSAIITAGAAAPLNVLAVGEPITEKNLTAYIFGMDKTKTIGCVFTSSLPDVPYITAEDYLGVITDGVFQGRMNADGTYSVLSPNGEMIVNMQDETIHYDAVNHFTDGIKPIDEGTELEAPYIQEIDNTDDEPESLTIDLKPYGIDIIEADGRAYFPLTTISDIFIDTYNAAEYCNGNIYFVHTTDEMSAKCYFDKAQAYSSSSRSPEMIQYTYNEMCFVMDNIYGYPSKAAISASVHQKGFDKTLDEYNDDSQRAKQLLLSSNKADFILGMCYLSNLFWDGGHTAFNLCAVDLIKDMSSAVMVDLMQKIYDPTNPDSVQFTSSSIPALEITNQMNTLSNKRTSLFAKYETVKSWDGESKSAFVRSGDTGVFVFDSFLNEAVDNFKWSLDYAKDNGIKHIIVDVSCNGGGSVAVLLYLTGIMKNNEVKDNIVSLSTFDTFSDSTSTSKAYADYNLDGEFNDLDKNVFYDIDFAVLCSRYSFSCGNLMPVIAKEAGIPVFGERSGGGSCNVLVFYTPELLSYAASGNSKFIDKNGNDVDNGAVPDADLTVSTNDSSGKITVDYTGFYDIDKLGEMTDSYYSSSWDPSKYQTQTSSVAPTQTSLPQTDPTQPEAVTVISDNGISGGIIVVWIIAIILPLAALILCIILNARANKKLRTPQQVQYPIE